MSHVESAFDAFLRWLARELEPFRPPRAPAPFTLLTLEVLTPMGKVFNVSAHLPTLPTPNDIAKQELTVTANGKAGAPVDVDLATVDVPLGSFNEGDTVSASLVYVDNSANANRSDPRVESLTVADTVAPPEPGEFGFHVDQAFDEAATQAPPAS